jgi:PAS domain S-box-containing protein
MANNTGNPLVTAGSAAGLPGIAPTAVLSRSPFERLNGPEANQALQYVYQRAHRTVAIAVAAHTLVAIIRFSTADAPAAGVVATVLLSAAFWTGWAYAGARTVSRQIAAFVLFGFVGIQCLGSPDDVLALGLFAVTLVLLMLYQDPHCVWPAAVAAIAAYLVEDWIPAEAGVRLENALTQLTPVATALGATAICVYCSLSQRKNSLEALGKQSVVASENIRLTAELEKARHAAAGHSRDVFSGSRSGFSGTLVRVEPTSASRITEERYRMVIETAFDAIVIIDADTGLVVDLNPRALEMLGRSAVEVVGQEHVILYVPSRANSYRAIFHRAAKGELRTYEIELTDRHGTSIPCEVAFSVSQLPRQRLVQGVFRDLTERKKAEAEKGAITARLQEAQRLESLNVLAGGIAHDFNNILMSILGFATIGKDRSAANPMVVGYFAKIESSTLRAGELCRQMLAFAGRAQVSIHPGDLNEVIRSFEEPLRTKLPVHVQLAMHLWPELPPVNFDTVQLGQVVVSMVTNATEAIAESPGLIQIKTFGSFPNDPTRADGFITPEIPTEYCAVLEITDTGCGMSAEQMRRIFEPFYSTKFIGRGLGLSETLGMIRSHQGSIQVKSKRGEGSSFRLYFPAIPTLQVMESPRPAPPVRKGTPGEPPLALVVDDESAIRELVGAMLQDLGFTVKYAAGGAEALEIFSQFAHQVSVVMLDLAMPGVPSHQVLEKIRATGKREVRVVIMSGYSAEDVLERCGTHRPDGFLPKPFSTAHLKAALAL